MKRLSIFTLIIILFAGILSSMRVEIKEPGMIEIYYIKHFDYDTLNLGKSYCDTQMALRIGKSSSMFYSVARLWDDSLRENDFNKHQEIYYKINPIGCAKYTPLGGLESEYLYKNIPQGKNTLTDRFNLEIWSYEENIETPQWELLDSTKTILGYECSFAKSYYRGRTWYAWYSTEIPINNGPWKLCGLPGLILQAYDSSHNYEFTANAIRNENISPVGIYLYSSLTCNNVTRDQFLRERYLHESRPHDLRASLVDRGVLDSNVLDNDDSDIEEPKSYVLGYDYEETDYPHE